MLAAGGVIALSVVCQLHHLRHLHLSNTSSGRQARQETTPELRAEHTRHATALQHLSSLTRLEHLDLSRWHHHHRDTDTGNSILAQLQRQGPEVLSGLRTL